MTVRKLVVVRHAKAGPHTGSDHERPLIPRGEKDAAASGAKLRELGLVPDHVACSTATRTRQTWDVLTDEVRARATVEYESRLYDNDPGLMLDVVRETGEVFTCLLVVGHMPSVAEIVLMLTGTAIERFPPGAFAVVELTGPWMDATGGEFVTFWSPR